MEKIFKYIFVLSLAIVVISQKYYIQSYSNSNLVLEVSEERHCPDAGIILSEAQKRKTQFWEFYNMTMLRNVYNGLFLDIKEPAMDGQTLVVWPPHGRGSQRWILRPDNSLYSWAGYYMSAGNNTRGSNVIVKKKHSNNHTMKWELIPVK